MVWAHFEGVKWPQIKKWKKTNNYCLFLLVLFTGGTTGGLAVVRIPGAEGGTVAVFIPAGVALSRGHPLPCTAQTIRIIRKIKQPFY